MYQISRDDATGKMEGSERTKVLFFMFEAQQRPFLRKCLGKEARTEKGRDGTSCGKFHHKLLHVDNGLERSENVQVSFIQDSGKAIVPIVSGLINGSDTETVEASVFCDSGAQNSIIRTALAECLRLESKPIKIVITKVEGVEEDLDTKLYKFPVCDNNGRLVQTIRAVGIPQISDETANSNVKYISSVLDILVNQLHRRAGPVDLLIGVNYPRFHIGETKTTEGFVASKSPLGYDSRDVLPQVKQVLHVRLATPTDITAFWKTEAIGVSVPSCTCEAGKMSKEE